MDMNGCVLESSLRSFLSKGVNFTSLLIVCLILIADCSQAYVSFAGSWEGPIRRIIRERREARRAQKTVYQLIEGAGSSWKESPYGAGDYRRYVRHNERERYYELHVPASYKKGDSTPVVLNFHGGGGNPKAARRESGMDGTSDRYGFIVVYPAGTAKRISPFLTFNAGICCGYAKKNNIDDVGFTATVLDDIDKFFSIDSRRVYATGFSNGSLLCYRLACELSDRIAAIAPVSGAMGTDFGSCNPVRPVSIIHFHGLDDQHALYHGGAGAHSVEKPQHRSVQETINFWVDKLGCSPESTETLKKGAATCSRYTRGRGGAEVVLWAIEGAGHTWPGGTRTLPESKVGKVNRDISASELMWKFFEQHTLKNP